MEIYINNYNNFIEQLKIIFNDENTNNILNNNLLLNDNEKINRGKLFNNKINEIDFHSFCNNKIKIFSHKDKITYEISESLFGNELCIKNLLNNQPEEVKNIIWKHLHTIWLFSEYLNDNPNEECIKLIKDKLISQTQLVLPECDKKIEFIKSDAKKKLQELLGVEVNNETSDMIDDIINSFEEIFNDLNGNPMANIIKISQTISNKYSSKIKNGNIEIDKIMEAILGKLPGMENIFGKFKNMNTLFQKPKKREPIIIDENFSTANVIIEELPSDQMPSVNIGSILKMADKIGFIPDLPGMSSTKTNEPINNDFLNLDKMMNLMKNIQNPNNMDNVQTEMDKFLKNELGLDINKINEQINSNLNELKENENKN